MIEPRCNKLMTGLLRQPGVTKLIDGGNSVSVRPSVFRSL